MELPDKLMVIKIGENTYAFDPHFIYHIFKYPEEVLPYPGDNSTYLGMINYDFGTIPVLNGQRLSIKEEPGNKYVVIFSKDEKKFALPCDDIIGLIDKDTIGKIKVIEL